MSLSVIIPTKDEAGVLPYLLDDLRSQRMRPSEIIIADASSSDGTVQIAQSQGVHVTAGGTPAEGRNCGAHKATGYRLLFLDADVRIDQEFIQLSIERMVETNVGAASFGFKVSGNWSLKLIHKVAELYFFLMSSCGNPHGIGGAIMIRRDVHDAIGGFDPKVAVGEDHEYLRRASTRTGYRFFLSPRVTVSTRRFERRGIITMSILWLRIEFHRLFLGEVRDDRFGYFD